MSLLKELKDLYNVLTIEIPSIKDEKVKATMLKAQLDTLKEIKELSIAKIDIKF